MKQLVIVRHAKSSWDDMSLDDHDRSLNERGHRDAPVMGKRLKNRGIRPDLMITSTARRAHDTCSYFAGALHYPENAIVTSQELYHSSIQAALAVICQTEEHVHTLGIFGHNPGFTALANAINGTDLYNIPTAGFVVCSLNIEKWAFAAPGCGSELVYDYPKKVKE